jgi:hypothetical protein
VILFRCHVQSATAPVVAESHQGDGKHPKLDEIILTVQGALPSMEK